MDERTVDVLRERERLSDDAPPERVIAWVLERLVERQVVFTTSFGLEGCALVDMLAARHRPCTVTYLDTGFWFAETYRLRDTMVRRYPHLRFVDRGTTLSPAEQAARHGPALWQRDPDRCCRLRKVEPMGAALAGAEVWVTAITRSQSETRAGTRVLQWNAQFGVLQVCPLAAWDRRQVWAYVQQHGVPYNELHERGYPTIGCVQCTAPVPGASVTDYTRAGRWAGTDKTECGLHFNRS